MPNLLPKDRRAPGAGVAGYEADPIGFPGGQTPPLFHQGRFTIRPPANRFSPRLPSGDHCFPVVLCAVGGALFVFRDRILKAVRAPAPAGTNALPQPVAPVALNTKYPIPTNITWTLDLTNAVFPETTAAGSIHGSGFLCERAILQGGRLSLLQGKTSPWDLAIVVNLFARQGEELSGKTVQIPSDRPRAPHVVLRWKDEQQQVRSDTISSGYALNVVFGGATNGRMPGKIYICLPDETKSFVAGTFDAEIKKAPPPKPRPPKAPKPKG